jgi:hypothetical protein
MILAKATPFSSIAINKAEAKKAQLDIGSGC